MDIIRHTLKRTSLYTLLAISVYACAPELAEYRDAMIDHVGYQQHGIPTRYILRVVDLNNTDLEDCYFISGRSSQLMRVMSSSETVGFPPAVQYSVVELSNVDTIDSITYQYSCDFEGQTLFGWRQQTAYHPKDSFLSFEKPIYLFWKEASQTNWNQSYDENSNSNIIIQNEGCFSVNHIGQTRSIENDFSIINNSAGTLYINHQLTRIIDVVTGTETPNNDRFIIDLLDTYSNNLIDLGAGQVVNFKLRYGVTIAGPGDVEDNVFMRFKFGETSSSFPKDFKIGAHMKFVRRDPSECP